VSAGPGAAAGTPSRAAGARCYAAVLSRPAVRRPALGAVAGRIPAGMSSLALLLVLQARLGSFAIAGSVVTLYGLAAAVGMVAVGRLVDRKGVAALRCSAVLSAMGLLGIAAAALRGDTAWVLAAAVPAGLAMPPLASCLRAVLVQVLDDPAELSAALSLDAVTTEVAFLTGPVLVSVAVAVADPEAALAACAVLTFAGTFIFARAARGCLRPAARPRPTGTRAAPRLIGRLWPVLSAAGIQMLAIGFVEVGVTARAVAARAPALAGVLLAAWAAGSIAGGLAYGSRRWPGSSRQQCCALLCLSAAGFAVLAAAPNLWSLGLLMPVAGLAVSPLAAALASIIGGSAPADARTGAFTWLASAGAAGGATGYALAGAVTDSAGPVAALLCAAVLPLAAAAMLLPSRGGGQR
jgi:MFS family permease